VSITDKILVIGGFNGSRLDCVEMLDLETETWPELPSMKTKRSGCSAGVVGDYALVVGRHDGKARFPLQNCSV